jgi:hypothetical protein
MKYSQTQERYQQLKPTVACYTMLTRTFHMEPLVENCDIPSLCLVILSNQLCQFNVTVQGQLSCHF